MVAQGNDISHSAELNHCIINPRRACAGGLRYLSCVGLCACLSLSSANISLVSTLKIRYIDVWIFDKSFCSEVMT